MPNLYRKLLDDIRLPQTAEQYALTLVALLSRETLLPCNLVLRYPFAFFFRLFLRL